LATSVRTEKGKGRKKKKERRKKKRRFQEYKDYKN